MTALQRYCDVKFTYTSVITIFIFSIGLVKIDLNGYVSVAIFYCTLTCSILALRYTIYVCFQNYSGSTVDSSKYT